MIKYLLSIIIACMFFSGNIFAQIMENDSAESVLDKYLIEGIKNNQALLQQEFSYQKSISALKEARGLFFPAVNFEARYSKAGGGREIEFPIGDLFNPIHHSLNDLMGISAFPGNLENEIIPFLREKEHDTKISVTQPIFKPEIFYNYKIKKQMMKLEKEKRNIYVRQLIADIKSSYFNYLKTVQIVKLMDKTELLLQENLRISNSLYKNNKVTKDVVFRAKAELSKLEQEKANSQKNRKLSASYFNFLLNKDLNEPVEIIDTGIECKTELQDIEQLKDLALKNREEIKQMQIGVNIAKSGIKLNRSNFLPDLLFAFNYGFQGKEYIFNNKNDYWMASAVLQWNLFNGFQDKEKIQQSALEKRRYEIMKSEIQKKILLQVNEVLQNMLVAEKSLASSKDRLTSAENSFKIIAKKYQEGMATYIEYLDSRTTMTQAEINRIVTIYDYQIDKAQLEKAVAGFPIQTIENLYKSYKSKEN